MEGGSEIVPNLEGLGCGDGLTTPVGLDRGGLGAVMGRG